MNKTTTPTRANVVVLKQMLKLIPLGMINRIARETGVEDKSRSFSPASHLAPMLFAQLSRAMGLNDVSLFGSGVAFQQTGLIHLEWSNFGYFRLARAVLNGSLNGFP
jgi:hypothetical protein